MNTEFYAFGEILWDCLPTGRHAGGAPFNVACHLVQLGVSSSLISSVGQDALGDEILELAQRNGVNLDFISRARPGLATGTVLATIDALGNATYDIVQPVAWDEITVSDAALQAVSQAGALIFGSLASRSPYNLEQLGRLLAVKGPLRFFDVNLRPPYADPARIVQLAAHADVLKLNHDEVGQLAAWLQTGEARPNPAEDAEAVAAACAILSQATGTPRICVTMGSAGAALWDRGSLVSASAPKVAVQDTVGAGDSFMAALMVGLTRGAETQTVLETACRLGAYVASQAGAIPRLPPEMVRELRGKLGAGASETAPEIPAP
ncbi:MAG: carbohydrate kinase [Verrucomicrobia bacterium]|nr:carbohydrate kinase [Verrucomicrobiota bacterium]